MSHSANGPVAARQREKSLSGAITQSLDALGIKLHRADIPAATLKSANDFPTYPKALQRMQFVLGLVNSLESH